MEIFISHKKEDAYQALDVKNTLDSFQVTSYLDLLDDDISRDGKALTEHIKEKITKCTDVIVVLSENTKNSWWVPFEIGIATERNMRIANYLVSYIKLPDYLEYWPRLKSSGDILKYVETRKEVFVEYSRARNIYESFSRYSDASEIDEFYRRLKQKL